MVITRSSDNAPPISSLLGYVSQHIISQIIFLLLYIRVEFIVHKKVHCNEKFTVECCYCRPYSYVLYRLMPEYLQNEALAMLPEWMRQVNNDFDAAASL